MQRRGAFFNSRRESPFVFPQLQLKSTSNAKVPQSLRHQDSIKKAGQQTPAGCQGMEPIKDAPQYEQGMAPKYRPRRHKVHARPENQGQKVVGQSRIAEPWRRTTLFSATEIQSLTEVCSTSAANLSLQKQVQQDRATVVQFQSQSKPLQFTLQSLTSSDPYRPEARLPETVSKSTSVSVS